jgi:hypothetical protein
LCIGGYTGIPGFGTGLTTGGFGAGTGTGFGITGFGFGKTGFTTIGGAGFTYTHACAETANAPKDNDNAVAITTVLTIAFTIHSSFL